jgi:hypothetical protein
MMQTNSLVSGPGRNAPIRAEELSTLKYWLANEDLYTSAYVRKWLERTSPQVAAATLAEISEYAQQEPHSIVWMLIHGLTAMLTTAEIISEKSPAGRKVGIRAAMLLAGLGDLRAIRPLTRTFEYHWFWEGKYQASIEATLLRLVAEAPADEDLIAYRDDLLALANRIWQAGSGRADLSPRRADLLIAVLRRLAGAGGQAEEALRIAIRTADVTAEQRFKVKETAQRSTESG